MSFQVGVGFEEVHDEGELWLGLQIARLLGRACWFMREELTGEPASGMETEGFVTWSSRAGIVFGEGSKRYMKEGSPHSGLDFGKLRWVLEDGQVVGDVGKRSRK